MTRFNRLTRTTFRRFGRRLASALLLIALAWTAVGVPIPTANPVSKSGELYPCANSPCGCASAEQCWSTCCCHTLAERLAWAREHGVTPPAFAVAEARQVGLLDALAPKTYCAKKVAAKPSCCQKKSATLASAKPACCQKHTKIVASKSQNKKTNQYVIAWRALACRGLATGFMAVVPSVVEARPAWLDQQPCVAWLGPATSELADGISDDPAVPPPERA